MPISDVPLVVRQEVAYVVQGALIIVASVWPVRYGSDVYDTGGAPVRVLQVCRYLYLGHEWCVVEWVFLLGAECDGLCASVHHMYNENVNSLYKVDVFLVSVG